MRIFCRKIEHKNVSPIFSRPHTTPSVCVTLSVLPPTNSAALNIKFKCKYFISFLVHLHWSEAALQDAELSVIAGLGLGSGGTKLGAVK